MRNPGCADANLIWQQRSGTKTAMLLDGLGLGETGCRERVHRHTRTRLSLALRLETRETCTNSLVTRGNKRRRNKTGAQGKRASTQTTSEASPPKKQNKTGNMHGLTSHIQAVHAIPVGTRADTACAILRPPCQSTAATKWRTSDMVVQDANDLHSTSESNRIQETSSLSAPKPGRCIPQ